MQVVRLRTLDGRETAFNGRLLASVSTDDGVKPYWLEMRLYQEQTGGYVLYTIGRTSLPDKEDRPRVARAVNARGVVALLQQERRGVIFLSKPSRELLALAARDDHEVADAVTRMAID